MSHRIKRREFITLVASAAATWPLAARAQQSTVPVIGYLTTFLGDATSRRFAEAFREGLKEQGFVEGQNVAVEYRSVEQGQYDQLRKMAADFVGRGIAVLFATPIPAAVAAKAATATTPIVFVIGSDPVEMGLVASLSRPGANATGATFFSVHLGAKRLELLRELAPSAASVALLVHPSNPTTARQIKDTQAAAAALRLQFATVSASSPGEFDKAFATLVEQRTNALMVSADSLFTSHSDQLVALAARHSIPTMYYAREFVAAGGLISYAANFADSYRQAGSYVARILKGEKAADLPVLQPTKFQLVINLKTAKALSLAIPPIMQMTADEVIE
ncbi:MAG: ABC transporter substrate-binding protein [Alphaproteobacteria bacterium]|nr:MAG: ABC transporter substrate-binding protein [Alphaproteobacteria bacterium]